MTYTYGSVCTGYEGIGLGLSLVEDIDIRWQAENDPHASKILERRFPDVPNLNDIKTVDWTTVEPVDIFSAGYPCQPFSHAGLRKGTDDHRHIWPHIATAVGALRPGVVFLENVAGHLTLGLAAVLGDLASLGYDATWGVVRAADAGAPHGRARVFILAADACGERHGRRQDGDGVDGVDGDHAGEARERQRSRPIAGNRDTEAAPDTCSGSLSRTGAAGNGLPAAAERGTVALTDPDSGRLEGGSELAREPCRANYGARRGHSDGCRHAPTNTTGNGWNEGWPESARLIRGSDAPECGPTPANTERSGRDGRAPDAQRREVERAAAAGSGEVAWGGYEPAIRRWERTIGRAAPRPTEPGSRGGERLSPVFVEWMQGLPLGWVTDIDISRNEKLKALGNGVVPQQCALAWRTLTELSAVAA